MHLSNDQAIASQHFRIRYCYQSNKFFIVDLSNNFGTFVKIDESTILNSGTVICAGESCIYVGIIFENLEDINNGGAAFESLQTQS